MQSGKEFKAALGAWAAKVGKQADGLARQVCQETAYRTLVATPVDTSNLRGNWQPSIGGYSLGVKDGVGIEPDVSLVCAGVKAGDVFYMVNNAAYARRLEYGFVGEDSLGRHYNQQGRYFVRDTVAKYREIVTMCAADLGLSK